MSAKTGALDVICKKLSFSHSDKAATICVLDPGLGKFPGASQCRAGTVYPSVRSSVRPFLGR